MQSGKGGIEMMAYEKVAMDGPRATPGAAPIMDDETRMLLQRRCRLCGLFYSLASMHFKYRLLIVSKKMPCRYHSGKFRDPETAGANSGAMTGWSCCGVAERTKIPPTIAMMGFMPGVSELVWLNREVSSTQRLLNCNILKVCVQGQRRDCSGCQVSQEGHVEDLSYSERMAAFPPDLNALRQEHAIRLQEFYRLQTPGAPVRNGEEEEERPLQNLESIPPGDAPYFAHKVRKTDTLQGLALHYELPSVDLIRKANPGTIIGDIFQHNEFILIPKMNGVVPKADEPLSHTELQNIVIRDFRRAVKCDSREEAVYYCDSCDYVLADAIAMHREDVAAMGTPGKPIASQIVKK